MNVYTYHEDLPDYPDCTELLQFWHASWKKHGWNPIILGRLMARQHPLFSEVTEAVARLPTTLSETYKPTVFYRWLALAMSGGGLMVDTDVINYGYRPRDLICPCCVFEWPKKAICLEPHKVPCSMFASPEHCELFARETIKVSNYCEGKVHVSDMQIISVMDLDVRPVVVSVYKPGWKEAYLVHYAWQAIYDVHKQLPVVKVEIAKKERPL